MNYPFNIQEFPVKCFTRILNYAVHLNVCKLNGKHTGNFVLEHDLFS